MNPVPAGPSVPARLYGTVVNGSASSALGAKLAWSIPLYNADCTPVASPVATMTVTCPGVGWCGLGVGPVHSGMDVYFGWQVNSSTAAGFGDYWSRDYHAPTKDTVRRRGGGRGQEGEGGWAKQRCPSLRPPYL